MAGSFIAMVYATLKETGIDTSEMTPDEAVEKFNELTGKDSLKQEESAKNLSHKEKGAIIKYFSSDSYKINEKLYTNVELDPEDNEFVKDLDKALSKMPCVNNITLTRDVTFPTNEQVDEYLSTLKVGDNITNDAYWSTTKSETYQEVPDIRFVIKNAKKARDVTSLEDKDENEAIYERGSSFKILSKKTLKKYDTYDIIVFELEEL